MGKKKQYGCCLKSQEWHILGAPYGGNEVQVVGEKATRPHHRSLGRRVRAFVRGGQKDPEGGVEQGHGYPCVAEGQNQGRARRVPGGDHRDNSGGLGKDGHPAFHRGRARSRIAAHGPRARSRSGLGGAPPGIRRQVFVLKAQQPVTGS